MMMTTFLKSPLLLLLLTLTLLLLLLLLQLTLPMLLLTMRHRGLGRRPRRHNCCGGRRPSRWASRLSASLRWWRPLGMWATPSFDGQALAW